MKLTCLSKISILPCTNKNIGLLVSPHNGGAKDDIHESRTEQKFNENYATDSINHQTLLQVSQLSLLFFGKFSTGNPAYKHVVIAKLVRYRLSYSLSSGRKRLGNPWITADNYKGFNNRRRLAVENQSGGKRKTSPFFCEFCSGVLKFPI